MKRRFLFSDNGTIVDYTEQANNYYSGETTISVVAADDAFYLGSTLPFNHFYVKMGTTVNVETSAMTVQVWDGKSWEDIAELIDETESAGKTLAQSGFIEFVPDKNTSWDMDDTVTPNGNKEIDGLETVTIYDQYWIKVTFSADLTVDLNISWIGQIFSSDDDLGSEFPDLVRSSVISAATGASNWEPQHVRAAKIMMKDLKKKKIIVHKNQILCRDDLMLPSVSKMAEMIYGMLGDDYNEDRLKAQKEYIYRLASAFPVIDLNKNARVDQNETIPIHGELYR